LDSSDDILPERTTRRSTTVTPAEDTRTTRGPSRFGQTLERTVALAALLVTGLMAGVFFAFGALIMPGLDNVDGLVDLPTLLVIPGLDDANGLVALPSIQAIAGVDSPLFGLVSYGAAALAAVAVVVGLVRRDGPGSILMVGAGAVYLVGAFLVTLVFNNRFDDNLAGYGVLDPSSTALAEAYIWDWSRWNDIRTVAAFVAFSLFAAAALLPRRRRMAEAKTAQDPIARMAA